MKLGDPAHEKLYHVIKLAAGRWLREANDYMRTAWRSFADRACTELRFLCRLLHELLKNTSPFCRALSALEQRNDPLFVVTAIKNTIPKGGRYDFQVRALKAYKDVDAQVIDRLEEFLGSPVNFDVLIGKHRIYLESQLCVMHETMGNNSQKSSYCDELIVEFTTRAASVISQVDSEYVPTVISDDVSTAINDMLLWVELCRVARRMLPSRDDGLERLPESFSEVEFKAAVESLNDKFLSSVFALDNEVCDAVTNILQRPEAVVALLQSEQAAQGVPQRDGSENDDEAPSRSSMPASLFRRDSAPTMPPPPPPVPGASRSADESGPPLPPAVPPPPIPAEDDDLEYGPVRKPADLPSSPPPPLPALPPPSSPIFEVTGAVEVSSEAGDSYPNDDYIQPELDSRDRDESSPVVLDAPVVIDSSPAVSSTHKSTEPPALPPMPPPIDFGTEEQFDSDSKAEYDELFS
jgi:hypothetical protein